MYAGLMDYFIVGDQKYMSNPTFEREWNSSVIAEVVSVCDFLHYKAGAQLSSVSLPWDTKIEIEPGDTVMINYAEALNGIGYNSESDTAAYGCEGSIYLMVRYDKIYLKLNNGQIEPINGYCLGIPLEEENTLGIDLPESLDLTSNEYLQVTHMGEPVDGYMRFCPEKFEINYRAGVLTPLWDDKQDVSVGDVIRMDKNAFKPLESEAHLTLGEKYMAFRMHNAMVKY